MHKDRIFSKKGRKKLVGFGKSRIFAHAFGTVAQLV